MHDASIGQKIRESMMPEGLPLDLLQMAETHRIAEEAQVIEKIVESTSSEITSSYETSPSSQKTNGHLHSVSHGEPAPNGEVVKKPVRTADPQWPTRTSQLLGFQILGVGAYVPDQVVTNAELQERCGIDPEWIEQRTGILSRRYVAEGQATSHLCIMAAQRAMADAGVTADEVDLVVIGTFTPDHLCPSTANLVQAHLGIEAPAMDLAAACSGFTYALATAAQFIVTGNSRRALVIGGDCNSRIVNPQDPKVAPLFGDGAGAVVLGRGDEKQGLVRYQLGSDGSGASLLDRPAGGTLHPFTESDLREGKTYLQMDGRNVFKWAVKAVCNSILVTLEQAQVSIEQVSMFILHQANLRIINHVAEDLGIQQDRIYNNLDKYGNTSAGSIPIALAEAIASGRLQRGELLLICGFGAGLTWGTCLLRW